ncbi:glycosyltransferase family 2 protein [Kaistella sp. 97-N-M2]|uniref:glycosyltransferase family 2 protein n=1 Tax=Kaistella sp. 97-N-M2 TaxID=2908645 RepID=UPI001F1D2FF3|nr:glycosyltransferase family 2 protein [Kaistella sp. 97-N-M2]UJF29147.1 glycosyltransferase family 2 protein [Kaistella sp. 97-N-M2]
MEDLQNEIIVSISCLTYNHGPYIRQCLDGFMMQQCDFKFEVLINDDASTDGTQNIIKEYQERYPDIIKPIFQKENQYSKGVRGMNQKYNFNRAKGKYIAMCEGDDYWIDPLKLQKQANLLNENKECSIIFHPCYKEENNSVNPTPSYIKSTMMLRVLSKNILEAQGQFAPTSSYFFKREVFLKFPEWIVNAPVGDYFLEMYALKDSYGLFMCDAMSVYRINTSYSWTKNILGDFKKNIDFNLKMASLLKLMMFDFAEDLRKYFEFHIANKYLNCCIIYLKIGDFKSFKSLFHQYKALNPTRNMLFYKLQIISSDRKLFTYFRILRKIG